ncbi:MAG TPA: B12-binding domain-containing radical SAM protein [archaeon]|nr:B12-binding domain-containing radical SAM protein [archaeon]
MFKGKEIYYCKPVFRPPSEAHSLLIQVTEGCTFKCEFCMSNLRKNFTIREFEDIKKDLDIARQIYGPNVKRIFLLDGNAMVTPSNKLLDILHYCNAVFPNLERCGVYAHSKDILKKSKIQLEELSDAGLKIAYVGFESGYDKLLKEVHKNATKSDFIRAANKLMKVNITLSATLINGLGGANNSELSTIHAKESADLVNKICPQDDRIWYISFLTLMIPPGTKIFKRKLKGEFQEMTSLEILQELKTFIECIKFSYSKANCIFRCNHASNYLPIKGVLEKDKTEILETLNYGITHSNVLRPDFYRAL